MKVNKCKICRRSGIKIFLKGERCFSPKCAMIKRPYPPGPKKKRKSRGLSEYGKELREKQKLKNWYGLEERQFSRYVKKVLSKKRKSGEDAADVLIKVLESRFDNAVFRLGLADSRPQARQMVSHGHFLVNGKKVDIPGYLLKKGDKIRISEKKAAKKVFEKLTETLKKKTLPSWFSFDANKLEGQLLNLPSMEEVVPPAEISLVFEFYSK